VLALRPVVLQVTSKKSYPTSKIIARIQSIPSRWPHNQILSIFRKPRNQITLIELLSPTYLRHILASYERDPFPFAILASENYTTVPNETMSKWIQEGVTVHLRIGITNHKENWDRVLQLWRHDVLYDQGEDALRWGQGFRMTQQITPRKRTTEDATAEPLPSVVVPEDLLVRPRLGDEGRKQKVPDKIETR
jgi:hypothetical protein